MREREGSTTNEWEQPPWDQKEVKAFAKLRKELHEAKCRVIDIIDIIESRQTQNSPSSPSPNERLLFAHLQIWRAIEKKLAAVCGAEEVKSLLQGRDSDHTGKFLQIAHQLFAPWVKFKKLPQVRNLIIYRSLIRE